MSLWCRIFGHQRRTLTEVHEDMERDEYVCLLKIKCPRCGHLVKEEIARTSTNKASARWWSKQKERVAQVIRENGWYDTV